MTEQEPPYPVVTIEEPFDGSSNYLDFIFKDPEQNLHGVITFITDTQEKADKYDRNKFLRQAGKKDQLKDARNCGVYEDRESKENPERRYRGYTIVVPVICESTVKKMIEKLSEKHGTEFQPVLEPVKFSKVDSVLPEIKRDCEVCGKTVHESEMKDVSKQANTSKRVCSDKCGAAETL